MKVNTISNLTSTNQNNSILEDISKNLDFNEKKNLRELLLKVPAKDLSKVLREIKQIPVDEEYFNKILQKIENYQQNIQSPQGFVVYA